MTTIEKAKLEIRWVINEFRLGADLQYRPNRSAVLDKLQEAIAALESEKPAEDARKLSHWIQSGAHDYQEFWDCVVPQEIQQFAEAYHAKRCAECKKGANK